MLDSPAGQIAIAVLFAMFMGLLLSRLIRRGIKTTSMSDLEVSRKELHIKEELDDLLLRIQEVNRECIAKMDTKIRMLNQLIMDAENAREKLETAIRRPTPAPRGDAPAQPPAERPANPLHEQVYELQDQGKTFDEITRTTSLEKGEIELILGLRKVDK